MTNKVYYLGESYEDNYANRVTVPDGYEADIDYTEHGHILFNVRKVDTGDSRWSNQACFSQRCNGVILDGTGIVVETRASRHRDWEVKS